MICYALRDMSKVLWGSHIRIFELSQNIGGPFIHGHRFNRLVRSIKSFSSIFSEKNILVFGYYPYPYEVILFKKLKEKHNIIVDVADLPHLQPIYFGTRKYFERRRYRRFFKLIDIADSLIFISSREIELFGLSTINTKKLCIVPNASNPQFFKPSPLPFEKKKTILCVSGYAPMRGIESLNRVYHLIRKKHKHTILRLVGHNMPLNFRNDGIIIERNKFYYDMPKIYSESYLCVVPHRKNPYMDMALPIKMFEAMAAARPIIVTNCSEMAKLVEREKCGIVAEDTTESLYQMIEYLITNPEVAEEMGLKGRDAIEKRHSWSHRANTIQKCFEAKE